MFTFKVPIDRGAYDGLLRLGGSMADALEAGCKRTVLAAVDKIKESIADGSGGQLHRRSGALARSWVNVRSWNGSSSTEEADARIDKAPTTVKASIASNLEYAAIHEFGGTVVPTKAKKLAIPLDAAKTPAGISKWASPRDCPDKLTLIRSKAGNLLLVKILDKAKKSKDGGVSTFVPMYLLVDKVQIPARHYVSNAIAATEPEAGAYFDDAVADAISKAGMEPG